MARLQTSAATELEAHEAPTLQAPKAAAAPAPVAPAPEKTAEASPEKPDPATDRGLRAIEQARKKFLEEQTSAKAQREIEIAEIARLRKEAEGKASSIDELRKLSPTDLLDRLDHLNDDDFDIISRAAYARTKAGKADPRAQAAAQEATRAQSGRAAAGKVAELEAKIEEMRAELRGEFTKRDHATFAERWVGEAVKAIPGDKKTFLGELYKNEPDTARRELLAIGGELEKANDGEAPTQAEVLAEFEKRKGAQLKALGFDPATLLAPPTAAAPPAKAAATRTLDVTASSMTRAEDAPKTREEKRATAIAKLRARQRATADQT